MKNTIKLDAWYEEAKQVVVNVKGLENYKDALLAIINTVRVNPELYQVTNDSGNSIYVTCETESVEETKQFLEQFGEITEVNNVVVYKVEEPYYSIGANYDDSIVILN